MSRLMTVLFHSFMGMRTVLTDYVRPPRARMAVLTILYVTAVFLVGCLVVAFKPAKRSKLE